MKWDMLREPITKNFVEARIIAHHAFQIVSLVQRHLLEEQKDDSHTSLSWNEKNGLFLTKNLDNTQLGLKISTLSIVIVNDKNEITESFCLENKTRNEAFSWIQQRINCDLVDMKLEQPFEIPAHKVGKGEKFEHFKEYEELEKYFSNAHYKIKEFTKNIPEASSLLCWPHHFDYASLIVLNSSEKSYKSIGIGLSPGDDNIKSPYFYVSPYPAFKTLSIQNGSWYDKNFFGAVLTAEDLLKSEDQKKLVENYLKESYKKIEEKLQE